MTDVARQIDAVTAESRRVVLALGEAIAAAHTTAEPALARAAAAEQNLYDQISSEFGLLTSTEMGLRLGSRAARPGNHALEVAREGKLLSLRRAGKTVFPGFQLTRAGQPRPVIADLITVADQHGRDPVDLIQWLMTPTTYLAGRRPVDRLQDPEAVVQAAESSFAVSW